MSSGITLSASMRSNLLSLKQTSDLQAKTQGRLATGKKVNSALDNPTSFFAASSLNNTASDLSNLLDGMGQAIQTITAATQGISSAESIITQMQAVANNAAQSAAAPSATGAALTAQGTVSTSGLMAQNTGSSSLQADKLDLATDLNNGSGVNLGITVGSTLKIGSAGGAKASFTVTATTTMKDIQSFLEGSGFAGSTSITNTGKLSIHNATTAIKLTGAVATDLGVALAAATKNVAGTQAIGVGPSQLASGDSTHLLASLVNSTGTSLGITNGSALTYQVGGGQVLTFTVGASAANNAAGSNGGGSTLSDLTSWLQKQDMNGATTQTTVSLSSGKMTINNADTVNAVTIGGSLATALGMSGTAPAKSTTNGTLTGTTAAYVQPISAAPVASTSTLLSTLTRSDGQVLYNGTDAAPSTGGTSAGDVVTINQLNAGGSVTGTSNITLTSNMTVQDLLTQMNGVNSSLKFSLNSNGQISVDNETGGKITLSGTAQGLFESNAATTTALTVANNSPGAPTTLGVTLYAGYSASNGSASASVSSTYAAQYDTLRTQLDQLVNDSSYQGVNLISGSQNNPLTVQFGSGASNASKLTVSAVDLTSTGLGLTAASGSSIGAWKTATDVNNTLTSLKTANVTLRTQAQNLGTNLTTVQTRQDFTNNLINTLQTGAGDLVNADMNTESANMLALQTQSQLGISSLSLASQAAQGILKLFP